MLPHWITLPLNIPDIALRGLVVRTLDPDTDPLRTRLRAVDFRLNGIEVSPAKLKEVAEAVGDGRIRIEVQSTGSNFIAAYTLGANRHFTFSSYPADITDTWRAEVIHESIHAVLDLSGQKPTNDVDEGCAYIGENIWWRTGHSPRTPGAGNIPETIALYRAANDVIAKFKLDKKPGQGLVSAQVKPLLDAINVHPAYKSAAPP